MIGWLLIVVGGCWLQLGGFLIWCFACVDCILLRGWAGGLDCGVVWWFGG